MTRSPHRSLDRSLNRSLTWPVGAVAASALAVPILAVPLLAVPALAAPAEAAAACATRATAVGDVQGRGSASPMVGQQVTVRGTVVGDLPGFTGFYVQDAGDRDRYTSDGVFVFSRGATVDLGDTVAVTGTVGEFGGQTQLTAHTGVEVCRDGNVSELPPPTRLNLPATNTERERLEGMLVNPVDALTVSEVFDLTSFGELTLSEGGRLVQPTELARPGTAKARRLELMNRYRSVVLDDGVSARVSATTRPYLSPDTPVRVGDRLTFTEPLVLGYGFDAWRLQPADGTAAGVFAPQDTRPAAPDEVGGDVQVAAFNVLNYFVTLSGPDARGARSTEQLDRQAAKIVPAIEALDAEVVTLMEIEDTDSTGFSDGNADRALADLVGRLNAAAGSTRWAFVPLPQELYAESDRDVIRNGIIYQPAAVTPVGDPVGLVEDEDVWDNARQPLAQTFRVTAGGEVLTVVANHFKSKNAGNDPAPTGDNEDMGDGQGAWNGDRVRQARSLVRFTAALRDRSGDPDVLLLGDFNAYTQEDPVEVFRDAGLVDLGRRFDRDGYSYVFDALSGSLDHAVATRPLARKVTGLTHWDINAVESFAYQYYGDPALFAPSPYRSSDHDPLLLGIGTQ